jgi:hypothetical protein
MTGRRKVVILYADNHWGAETTSEKAQQMTSFRQKVRSAQIREVLFCGDFFEWGSAATSHKKQNAAKAARRNPRGAR